MAKNKVTYMKLLLDIKLNDGTIINKGTSVIMNHKEGPFINVEFHEIENVKKIFWITEEQAKISATRNQVWTKKKLDEHIKDLKETWIENEKNENNKVIILDSLNDKNKILKKRGRPKKINN